jgi:hypothetical protein
MSEIETSKKQIIDQLQRLCAHCGSGREHNCPVQELSAKVKSIHGIPLIVNNEFRGMVWA